MLDTLVQFASSWCIPWPMTCLIRNCQVHMHVWVFDAEPARNWRRAFEQLYQDCPTCAFRFWSGWLLFRSFCALSELRQGVHILFEWWSGHMFKVLAWISDFQSDRWKSPSFPWNWASRSKLGLCPFVGRRSACWKAWNGSFSRRPAYQGHLAQLWNFSAWKQIVILITLPGDMWTCWFCMLHPGCHHVGSEERHRWYARVSEKFSR